MQAKSLWLSFATGLPTAVLFALTTGIVIDIEFTLGMIMPKGPGGVDVPTLMVISPANLLQRMPHSLDRMLPPHGKSWRTSPSPAFPS